MTSLEKGMCIIVGFLLFITILSTCGTEKKEHETKCECKCVPSDE